MIAEGSAPKAMDMIPISKSSIELIVIVSTNINIKLVIKFKDMILSPKYELSIDFIKTQKKNGIKYLIRILKVNIFPV